MKSVTIARFDGGLNTKDSTARLKKNQLADADNVIIDGRSVGSRLGQATLASFAAAPHTIFDYPNVNTGTRKTIIGAGTKLYADGVEIATGLSGSPLSCDVLNSILYFADGVNKIGAYNGTTVTSLSAGPNALAIKAVNGCLIAIGQVGAKNLLQWSDTNDPATWPSDRTATINDGDTGGLIGVAEYFHQLAVVKRTCVYLMDGFPSPTGWFRLPTNKGCVARESLRVIDDGLIWRGEVGVYQLKEGKVTPLSSLLDPTFATLNPTRASYSHGAVLNDRYMLTVASAGASVEDTVLVLDLVSGGWTPWRNCPLTCLGILPTGSGDYAVYGGNAAKDVVRTNYGGLDILATYASSIRLAPIVFPSEVTLAQLDVVLSDLGAYNVVVSYNLDNGVWASEPILIPVTSPGAVYDVASYDLSTYGEASTTRHQKRIGGTCRQMEITIGTPGPNQPWLLHEIQVWYVKGAW